MLFCKAKNLAVDFVHVLVFPSQKVDDPREGWTMH